MTFKHLLIFCLIKLYCALPGSVYWPQYTNTNEGLRYSPLSDITKENIQYINKAWNFTKAHDTDGKYVHQSTPVFIDDGSGKDRDLLIFCTARNQLFAVDPENGTEIWNNTDMDTKDFREHISIGATKTCRGVATWLDETKADGDLCRKRVYMATTSAFLVAVDAATGKFCPEFGNYGKLNLTEDIKNAYFNDGGKLVLIYGFTSAPIIVNNTLIVGDSISDYLTSDTPKGQPRGFDPKTGELKWRFYVIPVDKNDTGYSTWENGTEYNGGGNVWAPLAGDSETGIVYMASSSPHYDFYGGDRLGDNLYTDSVIALNAHSGKKLWHQQFVKHDLWNYDGAAGPTITTILKDDKSIKVVLYPTKTGSMFMFDAINGTEIIPTEEFFVPPSTVPGERTSPTQRRVVGPLGQLSRLSFDISLVNHPYNQNRDDCAKLLFETAKVTDGLGRQYTPPRLDQSIISIPGDMGGVNWQSTSIFPKENIGIVIVNNIIMLRQLMRKNETSWCRSQPNPNPPRSPYNMCHKRFSAPDEYSFCYDGPYSEMIAINLNNATIRWRKPYGRHYPFETDQGRNIGARKALSPQLVLGSGIAIGAGSEDHKIWVHDVLTGKELWQSEELTHDCTSLPMTYRYKGKQYIVLNCGGHWAGRPPRGNYFVAYTVPTEYVETTTNPSSTTKSPSSTTNRQTNSATFLLSSSLTAIISYLVFHWL
ncbi:DgyrCDS13300 [Dimorphilus gyrociliatus]|uniref:DgyrCDS13300 n=1 Tax=Dimorphilus gyrociliatus TaxID=2664684 RepID=A0A7I8WA95_9ANNE|nr:DgyrCDS13300 [Dimorphilus gyrociliatus]